MSSEKTELREPAAPSLRVPSESRSSDVYHPLETLAVTGSVGRRSFLSILDGAGREYGRIEVEGAFSAELLLGGELGWHRIHLTSSDGAVLAEERVRVDTITQLELPEGPLRQLWNTLSSSVRRNERTVIIDGEVVPFFIRWVRDDTHVQKALVYWAKETGSWVEKFIDRQRSNGMIYDYAFVKDRSPERVEVFGDAFHEIDEANQLRWERLPSEADVEYLLVENVYRTWQSSGDDRRMQRHLPKLESALTYCMTDSLRWAGEQQLVMRPYTLDTWDFKFFGFDRDHLKDEKSLQDAVFNVHPDTPMCVMHGDNSGMFQACTQLSTMFEAVGEHDKAAEWFKHAEHFQKRTNELCWNGEYYDHWVPVTPLEMDQGGVDGAKSFTLSNSYNLNRGIATHEQCVSIIQKYKNLREELKETHFAEWLSAHPCWPKGFSGVKPGRYVNGGILTIVAGELARGAFAHGYERYGVDILQRLSQQVRVNADEARRDPELFPQPYLYCGYTPEGEKLDGIPDLWGQAAVVAAFIEGLAGVVDRDRRFECATVAPRWLAAGIDEASATIHYPASDGYIAYRYKYHRQEELITLHVTGTAREWEIQVLLPEGMRAMSVEQSGDSIQFSALRVEDSDYVVINHKQRLVDVIEIQLQPADSTP